MITLFGVLIAFIIVIFMFKNKIVLRIDTLFRKRFSAKMTTNTGYIVLQVSKELEKLIQQ